MGRSGVSNAFLQGFLNSYNRSSRENDPELLELKKLQIQDAIDRAKDRDEKATLDRVKTLADLSPFVDLARETETVNPYGEYVAPIDYGEAQTYEAPTSFEKTIAEAYRSPFTRGDLGRNFKGVIEATPPDVLKRIGIVPPPEEFQTLSEGQTVIPKRALSAALSGIGIVPQAPTGGQTASEVQPPPSPAQTGPALTTIAGVPGLTVPKREAKPERATVNGQIVEKGPDGVWTPVFGEPKGETKKAPTTRQLTSGDTLIEQEWDSQTGTWKEVSRGPRYRPESQTGPSLQSQRNVSTSLRKEFNNLQPIKDYRDVAGKFSVMQKALEESKKTNNMVAVDQALITLYNKMTDPTSVVRESEYARTPQDMAVMDRIRATMSRLGKGGRLEPETRQALMTMGTKFREVYEQRFLDLADEYRGYAKGYGIDPELVIDIKRYRKPEGAGTGQAKASITKEEALAELERRKKLRGKP